MYVPQDSMWLKILKKFLDFGVSKQGLNLFGDINVAFIFYKFSESLKSFTSTVPIATLFFGWREYT
jgi:hypothetical protein